MPKRIRIALIVSSLAIPVLCAQSSVRELWLADPMMRGEDVAKLQRDLLDLGFTDVGAVDGIYGPLTAKGVGDLREYLGSPPEGAATRKLLAFLDAADSRAAGYRAAIRTANGIYSAKLEKEEYFVYDLSTEGAQIVLFREKSDTVYAEMEICGEIGKVQYRVSRVAPDAYVVRRLLYRYPETFLIERAVKTYSAYYFSRDLSFSIKGGNIAPETYDSIHIMHLLTPPAESDGPR